MNQLTEQWLLFEKTKLIAETIEVIIFNIKTK
jgi:hypothetical protein